MSGNLLSHSNSFGFEMEKDAAGCRALNRNFIVGGELKLYFGCALFLKWTKAIEAPDFSELSNQNRCGCSMSIINCLRFLES